MNDDGRFSRLLNSQLDKVDRSGDQRYVFLPIRHVDADHWALGCILVFGRIATLLLYWDSESVECPDQIAHVLVKAGECLSSADAFLYTPATVK